MVIQTIDQQVCLFSEINITVLQTSTYSSSRELSNTGRVNQSGHLSHSSKRPYLSLCLRETLVFFLRPARSPHLHRVREAAPQKWDTSLWRRRLWESRWCSFLWLFKGMWQISHRCGDLCAHPFAWLINICFKPAQKKSLPGFGEPPFREVTHFGDELAKQKCNSLQSFWKHGVAEKEKKNL